MNRKFLCPLLSFFIAFSSLLLLLLCSVWIVSFALPGHYRKAFEKYRVHESIGIDMEELLRVKEEMLDYLLDERESLADIRARIDGQENTAFFNAREIAHMEDVKALFLGGLKLLQIFLFVNLCLLAALFFLARKQTLLWLSGGFLIASPVLLGILLILSLLIAGDFTRYFIIFHQIFFRNDLWILDPRTDNLINMVPEGFFIDTAAKIAFLYALFVTLCLGLSLWVRKQYKKL